MLLVWGGAKRDLRRSAGPSGLGMKEGADPWPDGHGYPKCRPVRACWVWIFQHHFLLPPERGASGGYCAAHLGTKPTMVRRAMATSGSATDSSGWWEMPPGLR